jgi:hypothetical protein
MPAGTAIQIRLQPRELSKLDRFRRGRENPPSRGAAARELIERGLVTEMQEGSNVAAASGGLYESADDK